MKKLLWAQKYVMQQNGDREYGFEGEKVGLKEKLLGKSLRRDRAGENFHIQKVWSVFKTIMSNMHFFQVVVYTLFDMLLSYH